MAAIQYAFDGLPTHLVDDGVSFNAPFATLTVRDVFKCSGAKQDVVRFTARTFNVFKGQVGGAVENAFGGTGTSKTGDYVMTVVRHEVHRCSHSIQRPESLPCLGSHPS